MPDDDELAHQLAALLADLRPASRFHLATALAAARAEGVSGSLVIAIPRRPGDHVEVTFIGGQTRLVLEL